MRSNFIIQALMSVAVFSTVNASARTWRVELGGSGDFTDIQPAVEASAAGDTIPIGPGRFDTFHPCVAPAWTEQTVIWITKDNLTLLGSGQGVTIIGPTTYYAPLGRDPKGICSIDGLAATIRDLTIENIDTGIYWWRGSLFLEDCTVTGGNDQSFGGLALWPYGATIRSCTIDTRFAGYSCVVGQQSRDVLFDSCAFNGLGYGPTIQGNTQNVRFSDCSFQNAFNALTIVGQSSAEVSYCTFSATQSTAINVVDDSHAVLDHVNIDGTNTGIAASGAAL